jgi:PAS domain-containing protein
MKKGEAKGAVGKARRRTETGKVVEIDAAELAALRDLAKFPMENPSPILRVTRDGKVLYANDTARAVTGLLVGRGQGRLAAAMAKVANNAARKNKRREHEFRAGRRIFGFTLTPVPGERCINIYGRDVTTRWRADQQGQSLARFPAENPNPVLRVSRAGAVLYANDAARAVAGLLIGRARDRLTAPLARAAAAAARIGRRRRAELVSGERIYALDMAPVKGEPYLNVYGRDITAERAAEQALRAANESLEARVRERTARAQEAQRLLYDAIESITLGFALFDADDRLVLCNRRYRDLLYPGMQAEVKIGTTFEAIIRNAIARGLIQDAEDDPDAWVAARVARAPRSRRRSAPAPRLGPVGAGYRAPHRRRRYRRGLRRRHRAQAGRGTGPRSRPDPRGESGAGDALRRRWHPALCHQGQRRAARQP